MHVNTAAFLYMNFIVVSILNVMSTNSNAKCVDSGEDRAALTAAMMSSSPMDGPLPSRSSEEEGRQRDVTVALGNETMDRGLGDSKPEKEKQSKIRKEGTDEEDGTIP